MLDDKSDPQEQTIYINTEMVIIGAIDNLK